MSKPSQSRRLINRSRIKGDTVSIDTPDGQLEVEIPAAYRTCYWAVLKYMYLNANRPVIASTLSDGVRQLMAESDAIKWARVVSKQTHKTIINGDVTEVQVQPWEIRIIKNARNLCRVRGAGAYGQRLLEMGHVMLCETVNGKLYFTLKTKIEPGDLEPKKRGRKRQS